MTARACRTLLVLAFSLAIGVPASHATTSDESYGSVDRSTVRVFAIGTVGVETITRGGRSIQIAGANAGHGTGFAVGPGLILTANHVVGDARHVVVRLPGSGGFFSARVVYSDPVLDIAALVVESDIAALALADKAPRVRESVFAVGYPLDPRRTHPQSARGIIAGFVEDGTVQLDMALNPGNSGGPLIGPNERVIGMVVARGDPKAGVQGIGFAVPVATLAAAAAEAKRRVDAGQFPPFDGSSALAADIADRLIRGDVFGGDGNIGETRRNADVDTHLRELFERVDDADLLVFIAARLWNASLSIYLGSRKLGDRTLGEADARDLAKRLRRASSDACAHASSLDASVGQRSPFVQLALQDGGTSAGGVAHWRPLPPPPFERRGQLEGRIVGVTHIRISADTGSVGFGGGFGAHLLFGTNVKLVLGSSFGRVTLDGPKDGDRFAHSFLSAEIGITKVFARDGLLGVAYCPSHYWSSVVETSGRTGDVSGGAWFHARAWIEYRFGAFFIGAGVRVLSGPTFWIEPLSLGVAL